jgi:hypothetical protein
VLWIVYAAWTREVTWRRALGVTLRIGLLTVLTSLWWMAGLWAQGSYGLNVLKYTETLRVVTLSSLPTEVLRGLGYWFFYGIDRIGHWDDASVPYTQNLALVAVSFAIPVLGLLAAGLVRWRHRAYFVALLVVGVAVGVGANPFDDPSPLGGLFKSFAESSSFGLALRSTSRAVPLVALSLAVLLGVGVNAVGARWGARPRARRVRGVPVLGVALAVALIVLAVLNLPALWTGKLYTASLTRAEDVPTAWTDAIAALDAQSHDTRVLEIPGSDFAAYRWGQTIDPITPGLMDRPYVARELVPWGSAASADLLNALDRRLQEGVLDPNAIAPVARRMGVGSVLYRADLQTDRYNLARAVPTWLLLTDPVPTGLAAPQKYGNGLGPPLITPQTDETTLAVPAGTADPPPVSVFAVKDPRKIVHSANVAAPVIVSGDGEGLVDLATIGALDGSGVVLYSATFAGQPAALKAQAAQPDAVLVVTDSNRKRARRWTGVRDNLGATERADQQALEPDDNDNRLDVFPDAGVDAQTVVVTPGAKVDTTRYGGFDSYQPEFRGSRAFDGDLSTAWEVGEFNNAIGQQLRLTLDAPITTDHVNLVQPLTGPRNRYLTQVQLRFDGGTPVTVDLTDASRTAAGQTVTFPRRTFHRLDLELTDTNVGADARQPYANSVGFAEVRVRDDAPGATDVHVDETVRMPTDLVDTVGAGAADRALVYSMSRSRTTVVPPHLASDELVLARRFTVPDGRTFGARGSARLATDAPDATIDAVLGIPDATAGGITVATSGHLPGDLAARGSAALDGDPATAWSTAFGPATGQWIDVTTGSPVTFDHLDLQIVADGRHSVPTQLTVEAGGQTRTVAVPAIADQTVGSAPVPVRVDFAPLTGSDVKVTIAGTRDVVTASSHDYQPTVTPVAIAEVGIPGAQRAAVPAALPGTCRADLLTLDGTAVPTRLAGTTADALAGRALDLSVCAEPAATDGFPLAAGDHVVRSTDGRATGIDVDGLVLGSVAGGAVMPLGPKGTLPAEVVAPPAAHAATPRSRVTDSNDTSLDVAVSGARRGTPFWLVLGQSDNPGWEASVDGHSLGESTLVNGYANGWLVRPKSSHFTISLRWTPQSKVNVALALSVIAVLVCLVLIAFGWRRRRRLRHDTRDDPHAAADAATFANPLVAAGVRPGIAAACAGAVFVGVCGALVSRWWVGVIAAGVTLLVALRPRCRALLTLGAPLLLGACAAYVMVQQYRYGYVPDLDWPTHFTKLDGIAWLAVVLVLADVVVDGLRDRAAAGPGGPGVVTVGVPDTPAAGPAAETDAESDAGPAAETDAESDAESDALPDVAPA